VHIVYVQIPRAVPVVLVVRDTDARIARDHVIVNGQDGGLLEVHPGDLKWGLGELIAAVSCRVLSSPTDSQVNLLHL